MEIFLQKVCFCYISYFTQDWDSVQYSIKGGERFRHSLHRDSPTNSPREFVRYRDRLPTPQRPLHFLANIFKVD